MGSKRAAGERPRDEVRALRELLDGGDVAAARAKAAEILSSSEAPEALKEAARRVLQDTGIDRPALWTAVVVLVVIVVAYVVARVAFG